MMASIRKFYFQRAPKSFYDLRAIINLFVERIVFYLFKRFFKDIKSCNYFYYGEWNYRWSFGRFRHWQDRINLEVIT